MTVNSIDAIAPNKVSDDLVVELASGTAIIKLDPEGAAACRVEIVEPHNLALHQPPCGYPFDDRQVHMTCAKSAGVCLGDEIKFRHIHRRCSQCPIGQCANPSTFADNRGAHRVQKAKSQPTFGRVELFRVHFFELDSAAMVTDSR
jgi:hypothetical protein